MSVSAPNPIYHHNHDDETDFLVTASTSPELEQARGKSHLKLLVVPLMIAVIFLTTGVGRDTLKSMDYLSFLSPPKDSETSFSGMKYTLIREGYKPLQYFEAITKSYVSDSFLKGFVAVIEPHVPMSLYPHSELAEGHSYVYSVCDTSSNCYEGKYSQTDSSTIIVPCSPHSVYSVSVVELDESLQTISVSSDSAICMYVRREIRSLTASDLSATMDAMHQLWEYDEETGQAKYGDQYHPASYYARAHDFNAAQQDADHIHEGVGFLMQHIKLTNMFETGVQVVDPSFSLPYWDYTIDVEEGKTIYESFIFTEYTFGSITRPVDEYWGFTYRNDNLLDTKIQDGRWKDLKADKNFYSDLYHGFGYMRGPWNMNPSPYVSRFSAYSPSLPSCTNYYGGLGMPSFKDTLKTAPYGPHASTHGVIGSVFGCDLLDSFREEGIIVDEDSQLSICKKWGFYMKELYRANYIAPRTDCSVTSLENNEVDCGFVCNEDSGEFTKELKVTIGSKYLKSDMDDEDYGKLKDFICNGDAYKIFVGDHLESASPADPSFWPIHPSQERLFQAKLLVRAFTDLASNPWPTDAKNDYVCDKPRCLQSGVRDYHDSCCYGHFESDQLLDFVSGDRTKAIGPTNHEVLKGIDMSKSYSMNYVYDNFQWSHCEEDFDGKLTSQFEMSSAALSGAPKNAITPAKGGGSAKSGSGTRSTSLKGSH